MPECPQPKRQTQKERDFWKHISYRLSSLVIMFSQHLNSGWEIILYLLEMYLKLASQSHDRTHSGLERLILPLSHSIQTATHHTMVVHYNKNNDGAWSTDDEWYFYTFWWYWLPLGWSFFCFNCIHSEKFRRLPKMQLCDYNSIVK